MILLSGISLSTTVGEVAIYMIVSGAVFFLGHQLMKLANKVEIVHEYTISHTEKHLSLEKDLKRVETEVEDMKKQFSAFDHKLDQMMREIKKQ